MPLERLTVFSNRTSKYASAARRLERANQELWLVLSMFAIALMLNRLVDAQRVVLSFYALPTLGSAYLCGRRHATLTAFASVLLVVLMAAAHMQLSPERIEDARAAGLLHDIGKLGVSRDLLHKAAQFTREEHEEMQQHVEKGVAMLGTVGRSLRRVMPIVLRTAVEMIAPQLVELAAPGRSRVLRRRLQRSAWGRCGKSRRRKGRSQKLPPVHKNLLCAPS